MHHRLPTGLSELPPVGADRDGSLDDVWGRAILYGMNAHATVVLTSLGKDGKPGGEGEDADVLQAFWVADAAPVTSRPAR